MAENKQYVKHIQNNGSTMISEDVIAAIVAHAASEVEGVVSINTRPGVDIVELIGKKNWGKGIKVTVLDDNSVSIECNINITYGYSVVDVAKEVQTAVVSALESIASVKISNVVVNVCGIVRQ